MPGIFDAIQPLSKKERTTRSRTRSLRTLKRVVVNDDDGNPKEAFEHFSSTSLSNRITGIMQVDMYEPVTFPTSVQFLKNYAVCQSSSGICVTVPCGSGSHPPNKTQNSTQTRKSLNNNNNNNVDIASPEAKDAALSLNLELKSVCEEDDVIIVNPVDESVIVIEDSIVAPNNDLNYIPLASQKSDVSFIDIEDEEEDKDVIFVKEELNNPYNKRKTKKLKQIERRKAKQNRKKNKLKEATLRFFCANTISHLLNKRCIKCIKLNSEDAKRCKCNKSFDGLANTSGSRSQSPKKSRFGSPNSTSPPSKSQSPRRPTNNNIQIPLTATQNIPPLMTNNNFRANGNLREIVIDGSNIAFGHSNGKTFSVKGLEIAIDYFVKRGHKVIAFVPQFRQKHNQTTNRNLLLALADKGYVVFTPSREVNGRRITPYDDRYIIQYAAACEGVVVSSDNYRDLFMERPDWRPTIDKRLLMPTWVGDMLMFPEDPLGRNGPCLARFLRFP